MLKKEYRECEINTSSNLKNFLLHSKMKTVKLVSYKFLISSFWTLYTSLRKFDFNALQKLRVKS